MDWDVDFTDEERRNFDSSDTLFLLLQRGGCSFSDKVTNAELFGAKVLLISDYRDSEQEAQERKKFGPYVNDGALTEHIPAFEIDWTDAKSLISYI